MPYMYSEMQNKLSKTRESPLESMGQIISSRCPLGTPHLDLWITLNAGSFFEKANTCYILCLFLFSEHTCIFGKIRDFTTFSDNR